MKVDRLDMETAEIEQADHVVGHTVSSTKIREFTHSLSSASRCLEYKIMLKFIDTYTC